MHIYSLYLIISTCCYNGKLTTDLSLSQKTKTQTKRPQTHAQVLMLYHGYLILLALK